MEAGKHTLSGHKTPLPGLHMCINYTFLGIGVLATVASGAIAANNIILVLDEWNMLDMVTPHKGQEGDYRNGQMIQKI